MIVKRDIGVFGGGGFKIAEGTRPPAPAAGYQTWLR